MSKGLQPKAPRFHSLFERRENQNIPISSRQVLDDNFRLAINTEMSLSRLQFQLFPTEGIEKRSLVVAATLRRTEKEYKLTVYQYDPKDPEDERINVDEYVAWMGLPSHLPREEMIKRGSTDYDSNFQDYESNFIFFKKNRHMKNHHLKELPNHVKPFDQ